jgi:hypothetical protein
MSAKKERKEMKIGDIVQVEWLGGRMVTCKITGKKGLFFQVTPLDHLSLDETSAMRSWVKATRIRAI